MAAWEICEVAYLDSKGVSVQDLAANTVGVLAGLAGLDVNYQYVELVTPRHRDDKAWLNVPMIPLNETTYAIELEHRGVTAGYAYLGSARGRRHRHDLHAGPRRGARRTARSFPTSGSTWRTGSTAPPAGTGAARRWPAWATGSFSRGWALM